MQRIVIDTNVLVSSLIQRSYPYLIINRFFSDENISLCISDEVLKEYHEVLRRDKFLKYPEFIFNAEALLARIETKTDKFYPKIKLNTINDKDDNKFLELASASKAHFLITGNTNDFTIDVYKHTKIVTPKEYWENHLVT